MEFAPTSIEEILLITPQVYEDERGFFMETYRENLFAKAGIDVQFVQDNMSSSAKGTLRGLHYQVGRHQAKLVMVPKGRILDVAVDLRKGSPTFGRYTSVVLSEKNKSLLYIPAGFAHGFAVLSETALVYYKCSDYYDREDERGVRWSDPELAIDWQISDPVLSEKDRNQPLLKEIHDKDLFEYPL